jgi:hypothetical protein
MGVDTHMIAGVRACLTFTPDRSSPAIQTTPHYAEALLDPLVIPGDGGAATARFRSLMADRRILLILDNAVSAAQVEPLLPASRTCAVLITSRQAMPTLGSAHHLPLDALAPTEAVQLLTRLGGAQRLTAERQAIESLARRCAYLPLALRIAGSQLAAHPDWPVRTVTERLAKDQQPPPEGSGLQDRAVAASLSWSYDTLGRHEARTLRLLALHDGPDFSVASVAALLDADPAEAASRLQTLTNHGLVGPASASERYRLHDPACSPRYALRPRNQKSNVDGR